MQADVSFRNWKVVMAAVTVSVVALCFTLSRAQELPYTYPVEALPNTTSLYIGFLQSFGGTYDSSGSIPGVELALDTINSDETLLPGYTLRYILRDSFVSFYYMNIYSKMRYKIMQCCTSF